jgi:hypothetical protein
MFNLEQSAQRADPAISDRFDAEASRLGNFLI